MVHLRTKTNGHIEPRRKLKTFEEFDKWSCMNAEMRGEKPNSLFEHADDADKFSRKDHASKRYHGMGKKYFFMGK
ncbi:hypothetical protein LCGC14_1628560 [marine sediment metagenome]|uniref:Uncharacterized protein n=1 Tax=marine sediment metagenome TaxID=412755 RepID=A0A0F9KJ04_9ZZZZ